MSNEVLKRCPQCQKDVQVGEHKICPYCNYHFPLTVAERLALFADEGSFKEMSSGMRSMNPISLAGYEEKLKENQKKSSLSDAVTIGRCTIGGKPVVVGIMSFAFMGGSMGSVVGEKITQAMVEGALTGDPVVLFTASGGARMQEGIFSLMQMAKTASTAALLEETRTPLFLVLTNPTTGGVTASFAMLGDVILAEPGAIIGFAGPRVIEGTIGVKLPEGFQRSEFQLEKGFIDSIVERKKLKETLSFLIETHTRRA
ncbi:acetyl-CoA carboxylase, carboxyltransferase subunit beta [Sphaerochaeta halotolerans]|jgi:acetyl-CoA carboxylase carboxyl transferase subunit beta|uniref:acetyl-CoA carboxylase, carboxyltransferase subunit beta n=1 Tax=Sphaerochaeta halotolerans TaxID=2293840 RepID=UPI00136995F5|nr:acetyl-CoA carboxylase, carboxyltransferase subunit beta [Sphaerochaeta halotolerans]MDN5334780.1 acetyl-CoA carboxylase carboxyl transferase subunit beta [Sphaerochaeta sp.]MXI87678.1 acetyl-CoA carboxylase, carboxyltransferase subunit beta [Sphaerochaeta halotolerans]